jgi:GH24 family phage-related lysozyme (muramidase)
MTKIVISVLVAAFFILSGSLESYAFRCGDGYVSVGDSKTKVLLECGKPTSKEKVRSKKGRRYRTDEREKDKSDKTKGTYLKEKKKPMEKWFYNCGENDFIYVLTFEGGILKSEETGSYGKGKSDCKGR